MSSLIRSGVTVVTLALLGWVGGGGGGEPRTRASERSQPSSFEQVLEAHGGPAAIAAARGSTSRLVRVTWTAHDSFFERQMELSTNGEKFVRCTTDPLGVRTQLEIFDGLETFEAAATSTEGGAGLINERLRSDAARLATVRASNQISGLLPILRTLIEPGTVVAEAAAGSNGLRKFTAATRRGNYVIYADRANLIRRVDLGSSTMLFADVRDVPPLRLPFVEKILLSRRVVFEHYFSSIELNPAHPPEYFDPARAGRW